jgi:hypothetical protein
VATVFFTAVSRNYEHFVVPYIVSSLIANENAQCEVLVEDPTVFKASTVAALDAVQYHFPDKWLILSMDRRCWWKPGAGMWGAQRFLNQPTTKLNYTYIGDVDVLVLDNDIEQVHVAHAAQLNLPYSNIVRPGTRRLSGLHFVQTSPYFDVINQQFVAKFLKLRMQRLHTLSDEMLLFEMMEGTFGLPEHSDQRILEFRPTHGFHLSMNRQPMGSPGWGIIRSRIEKYDLLKKDTRWRELAPLFDSRYRGLVDCLDMAINSCQKEVNTPKS